MLKVELYFEKDKIRVIADGICLSSCASREETLGLISKEVMKHHIAAIEFEYNKAIKAIDYHSDKIAEHEEYIKEFKAKSAHLTAMIEELKKVL